MQLKILDYSVGVIFMAEADYLQTENYAIMDAVVAVRVVIHIMD